MTENPDYDVIIIGSAARPQGRRSGRFHPPGRSRELRWQRVGGVRGRDDAGLAATSSPGTGWRRATKKDSSAIKPAMTAVKP
jgi:hypothetical protein